MVRYDDPAQSKEKKEFRKARHQAFWNALLAFLTKQPNRLLAWKEVHHKLGLKGHIYRGVQSIAVEKIIGSVNRYQDFDRAFMPTKDNLSSRWHSIARAHYDEVSLPPVKLYQVGDAYFVLDGHHRISVARKKRVAFVDAQDTQVETRVPITNSLDADALEMMDEYVQFLERTALDELRPDQHIVFTIGGGYTQLLEYIAVHRFAMSRQKQRPVPEKEAVCDWYDREYVPMVQIIRNQGILSDFPKRTEADLYMWIMEHQHYLREQCGPDVIIDQVARHFADHHTTRPIKRAVSAVREMISDPVCELVTQSTDTDKEKTHK
jgi:hypothetical protein